MLVRGMHVQMHAPFQAKNRNCAQELSENIRVTNSKRDSHQLLLKITVASHVLGMHANKSPGIDEVGVGVQYVLLSRGSGGMLQKIFAIFVP